MAFLSLVYTVIVVVRRRARRPQFHQELVELSIFKLMELIKLKMMECGNLSLGNFLHVLRLCIQNREDFLMCGFMLLLYAVTCLNTA